MSAFANNMNFFNNSYISDFFQMGYAQMHQRGHGIHLRQYARAFIVEHNDKRVLFVSVDGAMVSHPIKRDVCSKQLMNL